VRLAGKKEKNGGGDSWSANLSISTRPAVFMGEQRTMLDLDQVIVS
jgi:hypothetical protein